MEITFFGSSSRELENRHSVSFLVEDTYSNLLIDCGPGLMSGIFKANKKVNDINNILLTHVHGDHISSFAYFVWYRNIENFGNMSQNDLFVYGKKDVLDLAKYNVEHMYPEIKWTFEIHYCELDDKSIFECDTLKVEVFNSIHTVPCLGCVIESADKKIVYSGDTLPNDFLLEYAKDADLLIHDTMLMKRDFSLAKKTMHTISEDVGKIANKAGAKVLALVHIEPQIFGKENEMILEIRKKYNGIIMIPTEGTVYSI